MQELNFVPLIIIGAGRSGTNMLRDIITNIPDFATWDCDEINPIWRYGNKNELNDEFTTELLTPKIKDYIRKRFIQLHKQTKAKYVVEKTCANALRLEFVHAIFPEAKFIVINRDGRDVVPSAMKRWNASFEFRYTIKKLRYVPAKDFLYYIFKFGSNRLKKNCNPAKALSFWGPLYKGIQYDTAKLSLVEICAKQWQKCASNTLNQRSGINEARILDYRYEDFVNDPINELKKFEDFLDIKIKDIATLTAGVTDKSVGNYKKALTLEQQSELKRTLSTTLKELDYVVD